MRANTGFAVPEMVFSQNEIGSERLLFEVSKSAGWLTNIEEMADGSGETTLGSRILFSAGVEKIGAQLHVCGEVSFEVVSRCSRCLGSAKERVRSPIESFLPMPGGGNVIDISDDMREHVAMAMPQRVVCRSECKGLCAGCGANLNEGFCDCASDRTDPRLGALKDARTA
ncbi:MAG: DUF177 domain-containing protein [Candidatus Dadabacteria bacterium]|nr:DUF177 domain-containing protein [Candidatus Dadabacteria bacterium]